MEKNINDFLQGLEHQEQISDLNEDQFYEQLGNDIYEAIMTSILPFQSNQPTNTGDTQLKPLQRNTAARDYVYKGKANTVIKRQDKVALAKNKDLNIVKTTIRSAFKAIIAASNKSVLGAEVTQILKQTERRLFQKIDQKLKTEKKK